MNILAAIRAILAGTAVSELYAAVVADAVANQILPNLQKQLASDPDNERTQRLIEAFKPMADPRGAEARRVGEQAWKILEFVTRTRGLGMNESEDVAQEMIKTFYEKSLWSKFNPETGPEGLLKFLKNSVHMHAQWKIRDMTRQRKHEMTTLDRNEEDDEGDPLEQVPGSTGESVTRELVEKDIVKDLRQHIFSKFKKPYQREMFELWMDAAGSSGKVNLNQEVAKPIADKYGIGFSTVTESIQQMKKEMARHMSREGSMSVASSNRTGSKTDRVAYSEFRRRIADWVLPRNALCRKVLLAD